MSERPSVLFVDAGGAGPATWGSFGRGYWSSAVHLGLAGLAASCARAGAGPLHLADCRDMGGPEDFHRLLVELEPDVVAFSARTVDMSIVPALADACARILPRTARILGGVHATISPRRDLPPLFHTVVRGEGEIALPRLLETFAAGGVAALPATLHGAPPDLDALPFPMRELYDLRRATAHASFPGLIPAPMVGVLASRGCPHRCRFCQPTPRRLFGRPRRRAPEGVVDELVHLRKSLDFAAVKVYDDSFLADGVFLDGLLHEVRRRLPPLAWLGQARCRDVIRQQDRLAALKSMGLRLLILGAETGSQRLLDGLHKGADVAHTEEAVALCHRHGIRVALNLMLGLPGETDEDRRATVAMVRRLPGILPSVSFYTPMPGSVLSRWCRMHGLILSEAPEHAVRTPDREKIRGQDRAVLDACLEEILDATSPLPGLGKLSRWLYGATRAHPRLRQVLAHGYGMLQRGRKGPPTG